MSEGSLPNEGCAERPGAEGAVAAGSTGSADAPPVADSAPSAADPLTPLSAGPPDSEPPSPASGEREAPPRRPERARLLVSLLVALCTAVGLTLRAGELGVTWDELYYIDWCERLDTWADLLKTDGAGAAFSGDALSASWGYDTYHNSHPPLYKLIAWAGAELAPASVAFPTRYRLGGIVAFALTVGWLCHALWGAWGGCAAVGGVLGLLGQPRLLAHASFVGTDAPLACAFLVAVVALGRAAAGARTLPALYLAIAAAFCVKFSAVLLPPVLIGWCLLGRRWALLRHVLFATGLGALALNLLRLLTNAGWTDGAASFASQPFAMLFLGERYLGPPPWYWIFVMLAAVPPLGILLSMLGGLAGLGSRARRDPLAQLSLLAGGAWIAVFMLPPTPRHDMIRQPLFVFALLGCVGGAGLVLGARAALDSLGAGKRVRRLAPALIPLVPGSALVAVLAAHPYPLSSFGAQVGGLAGATRLGFEPTYWLEAITPWVRADLTRILPPGARLEEPLSERLPLFLREHGLLRPDIVPAARFEGEYVLLISRYSVVPPGPLAGLELIHVWARDGVPLVSLYRRRSAGDRPD